MLCMSTGSDIGGRLTQTWRMIRGALWRMSHLAETSQQSKSYFGKKSGAGEQREDST